MENLTKRIKKKKIRRARVLLTCCVINLKSILPVLKTPALIRHYNNNTSFIQHSLLTQ